MQEHVSFDYFDFSESYIGKPTISEMTIRVPIRNFGVFGVYGAYTRPYTPLSQCVLVYSGVTNSVRTMYEYASPMGSGFKAEYTISDGPFAANDSEVFLHLIEAVSEELKAWVHWEIVAASVDIEEIKSQ